MTVVTFRRMAPLKPKDISTVLISHNKACIYLHKEVLLALHRSLFQQTCEASNVRRKYMYKKKSVNAAPTTIIVCLSSPVGLNNSNLQSNKPHSRLCGSFYNSALYNLGCSGFIVPLRHGHSGGGDAVSRGQHPAERSHWPLACRHQPTPQLQL